MVLDNPVLEVLLNRRSIRKFRAKSPSDDVIAAIVRAGQQAPFASQLSSLVLSRDLRSNPYRAPLLFTVCVDFHRMERILERRGWQTVMNDVSSMLFGIQDASLMAGNMVTAAESLGLGSCFLGLAPYRADTIAEKHRLPERVFPLVQLVMGYPDEAPPVRPRFPLDFTVFDGEYPELQGAEIEQAMEIMDDGYLAQDYYKATGAMIPIQGDREERFTLETYSWTEHMCRKLGQWFPSPNDLLDQFSRRGFRVCCAEDAEHPDKTSSEPKSA